tara:strand:- start:505 stop:1404 length:900 start_codon:yes stop_codon:yes gene_type:complete
MTTVQNTAPKKNSYFQGRKMWFLVAGGLGLLTVVILVVFLQGLISTTTYYVVNREVPARTLITPDMLAEVVTSDGGQPPTAYTLADVATGELYSKFQLEPGDILTSSNSGALIPLSDGLPSDFVIASFTASPNNSAGGNITRGDYVDIYYLEGEQAQLVFQRVLIVDATSDVSAGATDETITTTTDTATAGYRVGIPFVYTVGLSQEDAAKMALASQGVLYLTISSPDSVNNGATPTTLGVSIADMLAGIVGDSGAGTDNTFGNGGDTPVVTDDGTTPTTSPTDTPTGEPNPSDTPATP